ncbi:MAG TPA: ABC transporter ATP-binding protein [Kiritimatiellia bacterium]|nr:ABC transporter ATP-binding protein [Kiritimatiellia bacterium]
MSTDVQKKKRDTWGTFRRLMGYVKPYTSRLLIGAVCGALFAGSTTGMLYALKGTIAKVFDTQSMPWTGVLAVSGLLLGFAVIRGIGYFMSLYLVEWVGNRVVMDLRIAIFEHLQRLPVLYFSGTRTGELISRTTADTIMIERAVSTVLSDLIREPFSFLAMAGFVLWLDFKLALVSLVLFPLCIIPVALFGQRIRKAAREGQQKLADMVSVLQEALVGVRIVRAFGMEDYEVDRFRAHARSVFSRAMRMTRARASVEPIIVGLTVVGVSLVLFYARAAHMTVDKFIAFATAIVALYDPVKKLSRIHLAIQQSSASADRVFHLLDSEVTIKDSPNAVELVGPVKEVAFDHVSFRYNDTPVLNDINLSIPAGTLVAIVGGSGAGKTTFVNLLPRFFDVAGGRVLINGGDIREYTMKSLRQQIGLVSQETVLFNDTVARNIAYGSRHATPEQIVEAAKKAHADEFISEMPEKYETMIGERGVRLSGGQCQRLAIARAILRNPPILILDEATSALDTESERLVQSALDELMTGRTVFAIAHRLSTIMHADLILVLDDGRVVEQGTHKVLIERGGHYKYLYDLQFKDNS